MTTATTRRGKDSGWSPLLHVAFALGKNHCRLAFTTRIGQKPRERTIEARDLECLREEISRAKRRFGLSAPARVVSGYEPGRDGFWLHRWLVGEGVENVVVELLEHRGEAMDCAEVGRESKIILPTTTWPDRQPPGGSHDCH